MAPRISPPSRNAAAQALLELYQSTERRIIREIARKRTQGYVDYAELAALRRVRRTIQQMVDGSAKYVPLAIEHEFYKGKEAKKGYENALSVAGSPERDRVMEQLVDNLMGEVQEMAQTAYQSAEAQIYLTGRTDPGVYRQSVLRGAIASQAEGRGALSSVEQVMQSLQQAGITAFVDKAGREWSLSAYGSMAVRTTVRQAQVSAILTADDHDLWKIKEIGSTCPLCAVYEGRIYSKSGLNPNYPPLAAAFGKMDPAGPNDLSNTFLNIHPNCLVPGGLVLAEGLMSESRRPYDGEVITLETSSGNRITVTPNHPVLTDRGFIAAGLLEEGQKIIEASGKYTGLLGEAPNDINIPTGLEKIFHSLVSSGGGAACSVVGSAEQFHGDGVPDSKVDIVFADGSGVSKRDPVLSQKPAEKDLPAGHLRRPVLLPEGSLAELFIRALRSLYRRVCRFGFIRGVKGISEDSKNLSDLRFRTPAGLGDLSERQPGFMKFKETVKKLRVLGPELFGNIVKALAPGPLGKDYAKVMLGVFDGQRVEIKFPGDVCAREPLLVARLQELFRDDGLVVSVLTHKSTSSYSGFVYNLETKYGYYVYNSIVTHNCLHSLVKWTEDYKTDEEIRQAREFSSFETNPKTNDPRTEAQIEAYRNKERQRAAYRRNLDQFDRYTKAGVEDFPKSMETFLRHKQKDDEKYKAWMAEYRKIEKPKKPEPVKPKVPEIKPELVPPTKAAFEPAQTIDAAQTYAERFVDPNKGYHTGVVDYKGIDVQYANGMNRAMTEVLSIYEPKYKLRNVVPFNTREKRFKDTTAEAAYQWGLNDMFYNKKIYKNPKTFAAHLKQYEDLKQQVLPNLDMVIEKYRKSTSRFDQDRLRYLEALKKTGRTNVSPPDAYGSTVHELGHYLDDQIFRKAMKEDGFDLGKSFEAFSSEISAYATADTQEYVAESFTAYWLGEPEKVDPALIRIFQKVQKK